MNIRTTLMLMAASVAPLPAFAQDVQPAALIQPAQQAVAVPALAAMPANADFYIAMARVNKTAALIDRELAAQLAAVDSVALVGAQGTAQICDALIPLYTTFYKVGVLSGLGDLVQNEDDWDDEPLDDEEEDADETTKGEAAAEGESKPLNPEEEPAAEEKAPGRWVGAGDKVRAEALKLMNSLTAEVLPALAKNLSIAPLYGVVTFTDAESAATSGAKVSEFFAEMIAETTEEDGVSVEAVEAKGMKGVRITVKPEIEMILNAKGLAGRSICLLSKVEGTTLTTVVCENPEAITFAESPATSLAAAPAMKNAAEEAASPVFAQMFFSPTLMNKAYELDRQCFLALGDGVKAFLSCCMGCPDQPAETNEVLKGGQAAVDVLVSKLTSLYNRPVTKPAIVQFWGGDKSYHTMLSCDSMGLTFEPVPFKLQSKAHAENTVFAMECSPITWNTGAGTPFFDDALEGAAKQITDVVRLFMDDTCAAGMDACCAKLPEYAPMIEKAMKGGISITEGLSANSSCGVLLDVGGELPALAQAEPGNAVPMPRLAFVTGVSDRAKLATGWQAIWESAGETLTKLGMDPAMLNLLPIASSEQNGVGTHVISIPGANAALSPNITVSNAVFVAGTSTALNAELEQCYSGTAGNPSAGWTCTVQLAPLARAAAAAADYYNKAEAPFAEQIQEFATEMQQGASVLRSVEMNAETNDGTFTFQVEVNLN
ncbi:MAG: hypothetical protein MR890_04590 [Akkermansia muciniphila]|nr:hypothetical protein [Akkermansia muciniphila]